ncbi:MAG: rhomboid family intramembrane serine protease [Chloroflexi bacterium]|nr:MAG: rhomboid family intramembrane serine protease [Chloroflexota bacterium]
MTETAPPAQGTAPPGPSPVSLAVGLDLVTRYRLRLADSRDSRLAGLGGPYELAAASWTGPRATLVAFYDPPADPAVAGPDLAARCEAARRWGHERLRIQGAQVCDVLLVALRPISGELSAAAPTGEPVRVGAAWVEVGAGNAGTLLPVPPGLPTESELRAKARAVRDGAPVPTLAAVDLAERQTVAGGYVAPVRRAMVTQPYATYGLLAAFIVIYILEKALMGSLAPGRPNEELLIFGALDNVGDADWWRFVSSAFLHDNISYAHILFNGLAMFWIGRLVEQLYGRLVLLGVFLLTAAAGSLLWIVATQIGLALAPAVSIGASGGISGLVGLLLMLGRVQGRSVPVGIAAGVRNYAITVIALNIFFGFFFPGVNNFAHLGGVLGGAALGAALPPLQRIGGRDLSNAEKIGLAAVIAAGAVALLLAAVNLVSVATGAAQPFGT